MTPLLTLLAVVAANPVLVTSANSRTESGKYIVEIRGETAIDPDQVSGRMNGGLLTMYVAGGKVRSDNRAWGQGSDRVKAHRHVGKIELEASLPSGGCSGGVNIAAGAKGTVVASVNCATLAAGKKERDTKASVAVVAEPVAPAQPADAPVVAAAAPPIANESDALLAAVALAPSAPAAVTAKPVRDVAVAAEAPPTIEPSPKPKDQTATVTKPAQEPSQVSLWGAALKALLPVMVLGGLAVVGLRFAKKRKSMGRHVKILETTPLGPKRALIVAKIGGETLLLGSSEAGIALIQVRPTAPTEDAEDRSENYEDLDIAPKWADVLPADFKAKPANDEEGGQAKMLSRLFRKRRDSIPNEWPFANVLDASMLDESLEDRELRDKLAMGMEARVP